MGPQHDDLHQTDDSREEQIAEYLVAHPDFFSRHPTALAAIDIPHPTGDAVSLIERQVRTLREQSDKYRHQLEELVAVARENDALAKRLHRLTLALIETHSFDEVLNTLQDELREQFNADAVEMKLFAADQIEAHAHEPGPALFSDFLKRARPNCGQLDKAKLEYLFGPQAGETGSAALIPLTAPPLAGVLAIGSRDAQRFHEGKGVDFLQRLAEVVSAKLQSAAGPGV
ncbi:MAG: DUF484 family protein [Chromatiaceae bacterium]|nr:DUF484 family protein [Gammaproteobacteria bacterium]MCP5305109.1 DUF484 family protein [Chromatiaceae bacterium]MCP5315068.1 DUF484 family protein [Chromatiaceae bacterium]